MHSELEWLTKTDGGEKAAEAYKFFMRPDPSMRDLLGPIEVIDDPLTKREMRIRKASIAMVRGAKPENMRETTVYLDPLPHIRLDAAKPLQGWYNNKEVSIRERPRPCYTEATLTEPYGGFCPVGCSFCYVNAGFRGYRGTGLMTVPVGYGDQVRRMLSKQKSAAAGYFMSFSDPFLSLEDYYHNTKEGAYAFHEVGLPVFFLSRLSYPSWAIDLLTKNKYSYAQKSLNCCDPEDWSKLSPGALGLLEHMEEIKELKKRGIYVSIQCNPIVPGIVTHDDVERLFEMLAEAGADHVICKFCEAGFSWAPAMVERIVQRFGDNRAAAFRDLFTQNIGSMRTVNEEYRMEGLRRYKAKATKLGLTFATCFEYRQNTDEHGNKIKGGGVSVGGDFLTAAQCHGPRVPMFSRLNLSVPFSEVEECPPTGCLTCSSDNGGKPKCGNEDFGAARALRAADYRKPVR